MGLEGGALPKDGKTAVAIPLYRIKVKGRGLNVRTIEILVC